MKLRNRQPAEDLSTIREMDAQGTVPHPHEDISFIRRHARKFGVAVAGLVLVGGGATVAKAISGDPTQRTDKQPAPASQSAEPTPDTSPSVEATPTPEAAPTHELVPPTRVSVEQYPDPADAAKALHDQLEQYVNSGSYTYEVDEYVPGNPEYLDVVFGEEDARSPIIKRYISETYAMYTDYASSARLSLDVEDQSKYYLSLNNKDVKTLPTQGENSATVQLQVNSSDNLVDLREKAGEEPSEGDFLPEAMSNWSKGKIELKITDGYWSYSNIVPDN